MSSRRLLYRMFYRLGIVPWDGQPLPDSLRTLVESDDALVPGRALDVGCGTGDAAVYLAEHGWQVTGVDFAPKALRTARGKAESSGVVVDFVVADVTRLGSAPVGSGFTLVVDGACLHGMGDEDRDAYVREIDAITVQDAHLLILAAEPGSAFAVRGITADEVQRRFTPGWRLRSSGSEPDRDSGKALRYYVFDKA